mgnify:FL=1
MDFLFFCLLVLALFFIHKHFNRQESELVKELTNLHETLRSMLFIVIEEVPYKPTDETVYLAFDLKTHKFLGQDTDLKALYMYFFQRKSELEMIWVNTKDTGENMIRIDRTEIMVDKAAA